jgi:hypothetical protein
MARAPSDDFHGNRVKADLRGQIQPENPSTHAAGLYPVFEPALKFCKGKTRRGCELGCMLAPNQCVGQLSGL